MADLSTTWNPLFAFLNLYPTWVQVGLEKIIRSDLFPNREQVKYQIAHLSPSWREVTSYNRGTKSETIVSQIASVRFVQKFFYSRRVGGDFTFRQLVGKLFFNFRPTWTEVMWRNTDLRPEQWDFIFTCKESVTIRQMFKTKAKGTPCSTIIVNNACSFLCILILLIYIQLWTS